MILHGRDVMNHVSTNNMTLYKNTFRIESTRLKGYDYSLPGEYFITICSHKHECILGAVEEETMKLSHIGMIAKNCWEKIPNHFHNVELDEFVIMPNHIHGIIIICENNIRRDAINRVSTGGITKTNNPILSRNSLSNIIRQYKSRVSYEIHKIQPDFAWQPRFYEHIIKNEKDLQNIREYIVNNPIKWFYDSENPDRGK